MLGYYENFPESIHRNVSYKSNLSSNKLQQKLIKVFSEVNHKTFSFEEVANPTVPECIIIFEVGLADAKSFNYIDEEETKKTLYALKNEPFPVMDFFCVIRYYKSKAEKKTPLRFDYYMLRMLFTKDEVAIQVFHERGPRYISPDDIITFVVEAINRTSKKTILKPIEPG